MMNNLTPPRSRLSPRQHEQQSRSTSSRVGSSHGDTNGGKGMSSTRGGGTTISSRSTTADTSSQSSSVLTGSDGGIRSAPTVKSKVKAAKEAAMVAAMEAFQAHVMEFNEEDEDDYEDLRVDDDEENLLYASAREFEVSGRDMMNDVNVSDFTIDWDVEDNTKKQLSTSLPLPSQQERQQQFYQQQQQLQQQREQLQRQRQQLEQQLQQQELQRQQLLTNHLQQQTQLVQRQLPLSQNYIEDPPDFHHTGPRQMHKHNEDPPEQQQEQHQQSNNMMNTIDQEELLNDLEDKLKKILYDDLSDAMKNSFDDTAETMEESIKESVLITLRNEFNTHIQIELSKMSMELWNKMLIEINKKIATSELAATNASSSGGGVGGGGGKVVPVGSRKGSAGNKYSNRRGNGANFKGLHQLQLPLSPGKSPLSTVSEEFKEDEEGKDNSIGGGDGVDDGSSMELTKRESALIEGIREEIMAYVQIELDNRESVRQKKNSSSSLSRSPKNRKHKRSNSATSKDSEGGGIFTAAFDFSYVDGDDDTNYSGFSAGEDSEDDEESEVNLKVMSNSKLSDGKDPTKDGTSGEGDDKDHEKNDGDNKDSEDGKKSRLRRRRKREKRTKVKPTEAELQQTLPKDVYSLLIASRIFSWPFLVGGTVSVIQVLLLFLLARDQWNDGNKLNPIGLPVNVGRVVRTTQILAILISVFVQDDLRIALNYMNEGYVNLDNLRNSSPLKWWCAMILRSCLGSFGLFVAFLLIVESDNVFDLLLNFTGVAFISELDEISFLLASRGFFGKACRRKTKEIHRETYTRKKDGARCSRSILLVFIALIMYLGFAAVVYNQMSSNFLCPVIHVEFSDTVIPLLGTYNGNYEIDQEGRQIFSEASRKSDGRLNYIESRGGLASENAKAQKGHFGYCAEQVRWTFSNHLNRDDPCKNYLVVSSPTRSFNLLDSSGSLWYTPTGIPLDDVRFTCLTIARQTETISPEVRLERECPRVAILGRNNDIQSSTANSDAVSVIGELPRATRFSMLKRAAYNDTEDDGISTVATSYGRPIYWGNSTGEPDYESDAIDLLIFAGKRWIWTDSLHIPELEADPLNLDLISEAFNTGDNFHASLLPKDRNAIAYISDTVRANDPLSPLGTFWFHSHYLDLASISSSITTSVDDEAEVNWWWFPSPDFTHPLGASFSCTRCNNEDTICRHEGTCDVKSGKCSCRNGATGVLCEIPPLGNGHCDSFFNTKPYNYDGGDCCGATCAAHTCKQPLSSIFGDSNVEFDMYGFPDCTDPSMSSLRIDMTSGSQFGARVSLRCNGAQLIKLGASYDFVKVSEVETVSVDDVTNNCQLLFEDIFRWDVPSIQIRHRVGPDLEYTIATLDVPQDNPVWYHETPSLQIDFSLASRCLLQGLLNVVDPEVLSDTSSPQARGIQWLDTFTQEGSVCGSPVLAQQYSMAVLSHSGWFEAGKHCEWPIVNCNSDDRIIRISDVYGFYLNGNQRVIGNGVNGNNSTVDIADANTVLARDTVTFVSEIKLLTDLEELVFPGRSFDGSIPAFIGQLSKLTTLYLADCTLSGSLPTQIGLLTNLEILHLGRNNLNGKIPSEIGLLTNLVILQLDNNNLLGHVPSELGRLVNLESLHLENNNLQRTNIPNQLQDLCSSRTTSCDF